MAAAAASRVFVVLGGTGNTGKPVVENLSKTVGDADRIRVLARKPSEGVGAELAKLPGVEVVAGNVTSAADVESVCEGGTHLFLAVPGLTDDGRANVGRIAAAAVAKAGTFKLLSMTSVTWIGNPPEDRGIFATQFNDVEEALRSTGVPLVPLRCNFFLENLFMNVEGIRGGAGMFLPVAPDAHFTPVSVGDVGAAGAAVLASPDGRFGTGKALYLTCGSTSYAKIAAELSAVLGVDVPFTQVPGEAAMKAMVENGFPEQLARGSLQEMETITANDSKFSFSNLAPDHRGDFKDVTGRDPMSVEAFAQMFVYATGGPARASDEGAAAAEFSVVEDHGVSAPPPPGAEHPSGRAGWVHKRGAKHHTWHKRWAILRDGCISYFAKADGSDQKGFLTITSESTLEVVDHGHKQRRCFRISGFGGNELLAHADTDEETDAWLESLKHHRTACGTAFPPSSIAGGDKTVLVLTATGNQGRATIAALQATHPEYSIRGFTRDVASEAATQLSSKGVTMVQGTMDSVAELTTAMTGCSSVFMVVNFFGKAMNAERCLLQGRACLDAAIAAGVQHLVFSGIANQQDHTGVAHYDVNGQIGEWIKAAARFGRIPTFTILKPTAFFENMNVDGQRPSKGTYNGLTNPETSIKHISHVDVGKFAAMALTNSPDGYWSNKEMALATDDVVGPRFAAAVGKQVGKPYTFAKAGPRWVLKMVIGEWVTTGDWLDEHSFEGDVAECRRLLPEAMDLDAWMAAGLFRGEEA